MDHARFLISVLTERKEINCLCLPVEAIDEVAVSAVTKDIAIEEAEEKGDEVCDLSQDRRLFYDRFLSV